jgi:mannose PTS system EIIA component
VAAYLLLAHAPLASALADVARHVDIEADLHLVAIDVHPDEPREVGQARAQQGLLRARAMAGLSKEVLILTDVFGATPANIARSLGLDNKTQLLCGINVPLLWRLMNYHQQPLSTLMERALATSGQGILHIPATS